MGADVIDFPNSPTTGQIFQNWKWDGTKWVAIGSGASITVSDTAPASPTAGALWWDSVGGQLYLYYTDPNSSEWVPATNQGSPPRSPPPSNPNKLINPFMEIDQANEGAVVAITTGAQFMADGFRGYLGTSAGAVAQGARQTSNGPTGFGSNAYFWITTAASSVAAGDQAILFQNIEADEIYDISFGTANAQPLTVSFWAYCTLAGTYYFFIRNGATNNRSYVAPFTLAASTWQLITITIPGDTAGTWTLSGNTNGLQAGWCFATGATYQTAPNAWAAGSFVGGTGMSNAFMTTLNATFRLGPCKLEVGSTATPMLRTSMQQELSRCQRYYEKGYDPGTAPGTANSQNGMALFLVYGVGGMATIGNNVQYAVPKRATPTFTPYSSVTGAAGKFRDATSNVDITLASVNASVKSFYYVANNNVAGTTNLQGQWVADARL